jgi:hypothetical protein
MLTHCFNLLVEELRVARAFLPRQSFLILKVGAFIRLAKAKLSSALLLLGHPERNLTNYAVGGYLPVSYVGLDILYVNRVDVANGFAHFGNGHLNGVFDAFF